MHGFTREQAAKALSLGWNQAEILAYQVHYKNVSAHVVKVFDWGVFDSHDVIQYRTISWSTTRTRCHDATAHGEATAYTDGSGNTMKTAAGIGVYIETCYDKIFIGEHIGLGSNNRAELCAVWRALRQFPWTNNPVLVRSDSEYAIGALTLDWARNVNGGLIRRIREDLDLRGNKVRFEHVKGHSGIEGNEIADRLAEMGRKTIKAVTYYEGHDGDQA